MNKDKKLKIGILGSGNIGTDLLIKALRSEYLNCTIFVGRNLNSPGMQKAMELGVKISDKSIDAFLENPNICDLVFDATSAAYHKKHAKIFKNLDIKVIDMTPSQVGSICVPAINGNECLEKNNINMITCGGQASIPIAYTLKKVFPEIGYMEIVSIISSRSAGPGTRANLDEYIYNTENGAMQLTGCKNIKAIINLNPATPCIDMQTTIYALIGECDINKLTIPLDKMVQQIQSYVPGYRIAIKPVFENGRIIVMVRVKGYGDYLPKFAGNLDIINCAAISMAEKYALLRIKE